jgi:hypothetical protein
MGLTLKRREVYEHPMSQRVLFTFDEASLESLKQIKDKRGFPSLGAAVRESIEVNETLQEQVENGFTEIVLRNPTTNQEKAIVISSLRRVAKAANRVLSAGNL